MSTSRRKRTEEDEFIDAEIPDDDAPIPEAPREPLHGLVALVGRPNTGKSTLFNRLVGRRVAIVHDEPGVTRDRHYADATAGTKRYMLVDTGGLDPESDDPMRQGIARQVELAIGEADVVVCVLDARAPVTPAEHAELGLLRRSQKPVIYVANKADNPRLETEATDLYRLGMDKLLSVSALHGRGIGDLEDAIEAALPREPRIEPREDEDAIRVALIGRPNAGKSSLVNRIFGEERMLVDGRPGTTRDAIDILVERRGRKFLLIDTAGIRRKSKVHKEGSPIEAVSVLKAIRAMERAEVVVLLCDAAEPIAEQDAKVLGLAVDRGTGVVIALNKMDLLDRKTMDKAEEDTRDKLSFVPWAEVSPVSAKTGRGVDRLLDQIASVSDVYRRRVPTGELNRFFEQVLATHPPPTHGGRAPRLFYITQAETSPPLFVVLASDPEKIHFSYRRYVANQLRKTFKLDGVPVRVKYKARRRRELKASTEKR
ncbi:ribosome biogenesis GTPase Der [Chondromyces apiculatus]|uniref:GTPase Der n=1 Tax=Chondromyces apiculatus DSM 436 TaxID=1192034 RepID=A0A017TI22_9BACT|nr:ribosome biogenesis GTPase Der [Chondromyces apiculatus]EYF08928.1 GTP-binding protein EngA [Chondromyces apiculatus DSM 436]